MRESDVSVPEIVGSSEIPARGLEVRESLWQRIHNSTWGNLLVLGVVTALVLAGLWFVGFWRSDDDGALAAVDETTGQVSAVDLPESDLPAPEVGKAAPVFTGRTLDGTDFTLGASGKPTWVVFNATWCSNCRAEMPDIQEAQEKFGDQIDIVSVFINDSPSAVVQYSSTLKLTFAQIADTNSSIGQLYRSMAVPSHYFIDSQGTLIAIEVGILTPQSMEEHVSELLG
ncbi:MAG: TlpA disulfide reductase family protein [Ancrocorticia sp.]